MAKAKTEEPTVDKKDCMVAKTDLTILGQTLSRGQYFDAELYRRLPEKRQAQLQELHYVREPQWDDGCERCDKCGAELVSAPLYNRHVDTVHLRETIDLRGPNARDGEDERHPLEREAPVLSDAEFDARVTV